MSLSISLLLVCLAAPVTEEESVVDSSPAGADEPREQFELDVSDALRNRRSAPAEISAGIVTVADISEVLDNGAVTLNDYLTTLPGFTNVQSYWYDWPVVRGFPSGTKLTIDGISITSPLDYRYPSGLGLFLDEFDSVEVITGPAGVQWGSYSFLGSVGLITGGASRDGTRFRLNLGERDHMLGSARHDTKLYGGSLRLFAGYASERDASVKPDAAWRGVVPYAREWSVGSVQEAPISEPDRHAVVSARYAKGDWSFYLRLPVSYNSYQQTELGDVLPTGQSGLRRTFDGFGYIGFDRALLDGRAAVLARASWLLLDEQFDRRFLASADGNTYGSGLLLDSRVSVATTLVDFSYRLRGSWYRSDFLFGSEGVLELPHSNQVSQSVRELDGLRYPIGESFESRETIFGSAYLFNESGFFDIITAGLGVRHSFGGGIYKDTQLYLANVALRIYADTNLKFSITEGIRPPQILDRQGLWPVRGRGDLAPEKAQSVQVEANTTWAHVGFIERLSARANYGVTTTTDNILRESSTFVPFEQRPVSAAGYVIQSLDATMEMRLRPWGARLSALYSLNEVFDRRSRSSDPTIQQEAAENPLCGLGECVNRGPRHRIWGRFGANIGSQVWAQSSLELQCGVKWLNTASLTDRGRSIRPDVQDPKSVTEQRCYPMLGFLARYPGTERGVQLVVGVNNILGSQPPPAAFYLPELRGAEPQMPQTQGRLAYLALRIETAAGND